MTDALEALRTLAQELGLDGNPELYNATRTVVGRLGGLQLRIAVRLDRGAFWLTINVKGEPRAGPIRIEPSRPWPRPRRASRILTGDLRFDGRVMVYGSPGLVAAIMTDRARAWALDVLTDGRSMISLRAGGLRYAACFDSLTPLSPHVRRFRRLVGGWNLWGPIAGLAPRWASNATTDRDRRVRALNARLLLASPSAPTDALLSVARADCLPSGLREEAMLGLSSRGLGIDDLAALLGTEDMSVRRAAVWLAVDLGSPAVMPNRARAWSRPRSGWGRAAGGGARGAGRRSCGAVAVGAARA